MLGLVVAVAVGATLLVRELNPASARTADAIMSMTLTDGGTCFTQWDCSVPAGGAFTVTIFAEVPPAENYYGWQSDLDYSELVANGGEYHATPVVGDDVVWPLSSFPSRLPNAPRERRVR